MTKPTENKPETVPAGAIRAGEILLRWSWVESRVWTERMLTALEQGVNGGTWLAIIIAGQTPSLPSMGCIA